MLGRLRRSRERDEFVARAGDNALKVSQQFLVLDVRARLERLDRSLTGSDENLQERDFFFFSAGHVAREFASYALRLRVSGGEDRPSCRAELLVLGEAEPDERGALNVAALTKKFSRERAMMLDRQLVDPLIDVFAYRPGRPSSLSALVDRSHGVTLARQRRANRRERILKSLRGQRNFSRSCEGSPASVKPSPGRERCLSPRKTVLPWT